MKIVDAQIHVWKSGTSAGTTHQQSLFTASDAIAGMDEAGINQAVIVPPSWSLHPNGEALEAVRLYPGRFAIMGRLPLDRPESRSAIESWLRQPGMLGLRYSFTQSSARAMLTDGTADWLWPAAERADLPLMVFATIALPEIGRIAERHPGLRLIIDHMGAPSLLQDDAAFAYLPNLLALARYPNVAVKVSAVPGASSEAYPYRNIHTYVRRIIETFGAARSFWGTDITRMPCSWQQCITLFTEEFPWLTGTDLELVMGKALCDWLGWTVQT